MKINIEKKKYLLILIIFISIGFAYLSTNLNINGLFDFASSSWDVHFDNVQIITNDIDADTPVLDTNKTSLNFSGDFSEPSEVFEFSVDVVNDGTINAMLNEILKTGITVENANFLDFMVSYYDETELTKLDLLKGKTRTRIKVKVEYKYDVETLATLDEQNFSLTLNYVSATKEAIDRKNDFQFSGNSSVIALSNAKENSLSNLRIYGNSNQITYSGQNLYNASEICKKTECEKYGITVDKNGWITVTADASDSAENIYIFVRTNDLNLETSKKYSVITEIKSVTGQNLFLHSFSYYNNKGQLNGNKAFNVSEMQKTSLDITSSNVATDNNIPGLATYIEIYSGSSGSVTFRLSVIEGTDVSADNFKYEPYVGEKVSPNPEYPQEVKSVTGNSDLTITGKNLFSLNLDGLAMMDGQTAAFLHNNNGWWSSHNLNLPKLVVGETYTISATFVNNNSNYSSGIHFWFDISGGKMSNNVLLSKQNGYKNTFVCAADDFFRLRIAFDNSKTEETDFAVRFQIEAGSEATEWEPYLGHNYDLALNNINLNGIDDYRDYIHNVNGKWYVHKEIEEYTFKGDEEFYSLASGIEGALNKKRFGIRNIPIKYLPLDKRGCISEKFLGIPYDNNRRTNTVINSTALWEGQVIAFTTDSETMTVDEFKSLITGSKYYYVLNKPKEVEIKDQNLINQLNSITDNNLYDGYNYLVFDSNIKTNIDFDYKN